MEGVAVQDTVGPVYAEEALEAAAQAVHHYQALAERRPDAHLPDLARALYNRSLYLSALDRAEEALETITRAVDIRTAPAEERPAVHRHELEGSLRLLEDLRNAEAGRE